MYIYEQYSAKIFVSNSSTIVEANEIIILTFHFSAILNICS